MKRRGDERRLSDAEAALWRAAVQDAVPLTKRPPPAIAAEKRRIAVETVRRERPSPPPNILTPALPPARKAQQLDRATFSRIKKGRLPIEGRLDLHGMTAARAEQALARFLRSSQAAGKRAVLVITGRGRDPDGLGRGVLKRETPRWLDRMPDLVASYGDADRRHGGEGALYVRIRRRDKAMRQ